MKKLWKWRCVVTWIFSAVGAAFGTFMLTSYFLPEFRIGYLDLLNPLYTAKTNEFIVMSFTVVFLFRIISGLIFRTGILSLFPRFRDGII